MGDISEALERVKLLAQETPKDGFEVNYLQRGEKMLELYGKALAFSEEIEEPEKEIQQIIQEMDELL